MTLSDVKTLLNCEVLSKRYEPDHNIETACGSDMMSDVLALVKKDAVLLTGLVNTQVMRTAEMLDIVCIIFVRGKSPKDEMLDMADDLNMMILKTDYTMFEACGILYEAGLKGGVKA